MLSRFEPPAISPRPTLSGRASRLTTSGLLRLVLSSCLAAAAGPTIRAQVDAPGAVAHAFFDALAGGDADRFETMARERYAPSLIEQRTPAGRRQFVERVRSEFGTLTLVGVRNINDERLTLDVRGSTGLEGRLELTIEAAPPHRITAVRVEVGEGERGEGAAAPPPPITGVMAPAELARALDAYLEPRAVAGEFSGVVAIARDGRTIYEKAFGLADRDAQTPVSAATRFNVASIGKAFTKTAIARLVAEGRFSFTDTIGALLPDYPNEVSRAATIDQLLTHQGGIADFFGPGFEKAPKAGFASNADYYRYVSSRPPVFAPGTKKQYCNGCYVVLGEIIERVTGQRYEDYIVATVFTPAGMKGAGFLRSDRPAPDVAQQYSRTLDPGGSLRNARDAHGVAGSGAGGVYATAADLLAFDAAMRAGRLLDPKMTAWFLGGEPAGAGSRAPGAYGIAGGAPGTNALLDADVTWAVAVVGNLDPPAAVSLGQAIKERLSR